MVFEIIKSEKIFVKYKKTTLVYGVVFSFKKAF